MVNEPWKNSMNLIIRSARVDEGIEYHVEKSQEVGSFSFFHHWDASSCTYIYNY